MREANWWRRTNMLIESMAADDELRFLEAAHSRQCAFMANSDLNEDSFKSSQHHSQEILQEILNLTKPWAAKTLGQVKQEEIQHLIDDYKRMVGDPADPAFQAQLLEAVEMDRQRRMQAPVETDEQRIDRLITERALQRTAKDRR